MVDILSIVVLLLVLVMALVVFAMLAATYLPLVTAAAGG